MANSAYLLSLYLMVLNITCHYLADALRRLLGRLLEVILTANGLRLTF